MARLNRSSPMGLRDRRAAGAGAISGPCRLLKRGYDGLSRGDKILLWITFFLLTANFLIFGFGPEEESSGRGEKSSVSIAGHLRGVKDKWDKLFIPSTPQVAAMVAAFDWGVAKFERPVECSADMIQKIRDSGMDGADCDLSPFTQKCKQTKLTKTPKNSWIEGFVDEVKELRKDGKGGGAQKATFVAVLLGYDCSKLTEALRAPKEVPELTKWPWLWCSEPYENKESTKWGMVAESIEGTTMDKKMISRDLREAVKDAVISTSNDDSAMMFQGGIKTLTRTRYVEFAIDWKGAWDNKNVKDAIDQMDRIGHTCYWAGEEKLWRITGCWQEVYSKKTWGHMACAHRVLAPKLAERMEGVFKKTIGMA